MALVLTEEQSMLRDSARGLISDKAPVAHLRSLRDSKDATGFSRDLWKTFAEMGFSGLLVPENFGGSGLGCVEAGVVMEEIGRTLMPSPFLATAVLAASALSRGGSAAQKSEHLPKIVAGSLLAALAIDEGTKHRPLMTKMQAVGSGNGFRLKGGKAIGEFQALQHRAAQLYIEIEITRSAVLKALQTLDADFENAGAAVAVAKARAGSTATLAVQEGVQMHGGMGMTDQFDIGFFMKRAGLPGIVRGQQLPRRSAGADEELLRATPSFRDGPKDQTSGAQLRTGESRDSGFALSAPRVDGLAAVTGSAGRTGCRRCSRANSARAGSSASILRRHCARRSRRNCRHGG